MSRMFVKAWAYQRKPHDESKSAETMELHLRRKRLQSGESIRSSRDRRGVRGVRGGGTPPPGRTGTRGRGSGEDRGGARGDRTAGGKARSSWCAPTQAAV